MIRLFSNPTAMPDQLARMIEVLTIVLNAIEKRMGQFGPRGAGQVYVSALKAVISNDAHSIVVETMTNYELTKPERKVLESAARLYSKRRVALRGDSTKKLSDFVNDVKKQRDVFARLYAGGELARGAHANTFILLNAGGFSKKMVDTVAAQVKRAGELLADVNLEKACYGEVVMTNTVMRHSVLAFYLHEQDKLYVRANRRSASDAEILHALLHELGHRVFQRFLSVAQVEYADMLYLWLAHQPYRDVEGPHIGQLVKERKKTYEVSSIDYGIVRLKRADGVRASLPLHRWGELVGKTPFVSYYAGKDTEENFCEMLAQYCMDGEGWRESPEEARRRFLRILHR